MAVWPTQDFIVAKPGLNKTTTTTKLNEILSLAIKLIDLGDILLCEIPGTI